MTVYRVEDYVDKSRIKGCVCYDNSGKLIFPYKFRNQKRIHFGSCTHHSLCPVIEYLYNGDGEDGKKQKVDIGWLVRTLDPPVGATKLIDFFANHVTDKGIGLIRAESHDYPFKLAGNPTRLFLKKYPDHLQRAVDHFRNEKTPAIGVFSFTKNSKPKVGEIFVSDNVKEDTNCPKCGSSIVSRHTVCFTAIAYSDFAPDDFRRLFEYIDSDRPGQLHYMTVESMDIVVIPRSDSVRYPNVGSCAFV